MSVQRVRWHGAGSRGARRRHARRRTQRAHAADAWHAADACGRRAQRAQGTPASGRQAPTAPPAGQTAIVPDVAGPARPRKPPCRPACRLRGRHEGEMRQHDPVALSDLPSDRGGGGCTAWPAPPWHAAICDTNSMAADVWQNYGPVTSIFRLKQIRRCAVRLCGDGRVHGSFLPGLAGRARPLGPAWPAVTPVACGASGRYGVQCRRSSVVHPACCPAWPVWCRAAAARPGADRVCARPPDAIGYACTMAGPGVRPRLLCPGCGAGRFLRHAAARPFEGRLRRRPFSASFAGSSLFPFPDRPVRSLPPVHSCPSSCPATVPG